MSNKAKISPHTLATAVICTLIILSCTVLVGMKPKYPEPGDEFFKPSWKVMEEELNEIQKQQILKNFRETVVKITTVDVSKPKTVYELGYKLYGFDELTVSRILKICTREGYAQDHLLSEYVCMCAINRQLENLWGYSDIYSSFGEMDASYGLWMDGIEVAYWAYPALWDAMLYLDRNVRYCNGVRKDYGNAIYVSPTYRNIGVWY